MCVRGKVPLYKLCLKPEFISKFLRCTTVCDLLIKIVINHIFSCLLPPILQEIGNKISNLEANTQAKGDAVLETQELIK